MSHFNFCFFFFFCAPASTLIYTLSLHDALPISFSFVDLEVSAGEDSTTGADWFGFCAGAGAAIPLRRAWIIDRKSTRLNSSHGYISYAVFCLKKKKINT